MILCADQDVTYADETYWKNGNAAQSVLLIDEATQAITEALHRIRNDTVLDDRDLAAAEVALGDLFGGLGQLATLLALSAHRRANLPAGPRQPRPAQRCVRSAS